MKLMKVKINNILYVIDIDNIAYIRSPEFDFTGTEIQLKQLHADNIEYLHINASIEEVILAIELSEEM